MTTTITEPQLAHTVERYVRFWNSTPEQQRRRGHETFAEDVTYAAPAGLLTGVGALADFTEQFLGEAGAGYEYRARTAPDLHHGHARLQWELLVGDQSFAEGTDVLVLGSDGRVTSVATFIDRAPARQPHHGDEQPG